MTFILSLFPEWQSFWRYCELFAKCCPTTYAIWAIIISNRWALNMNYLTHWHLEYMIVMAHENVMTEKQYRENYLIETCFTLGFSNSTSPRIFLKY